MDYSKMTKAELIEQLQNQPKLDNSEVNQLTHQNEIFMKGVKEKDVIINKLKEEITNLQQHHQKILGDIEAQVNQKINTLSVQNVAIAKEFKEVEEGIAVFINTTDDLLTYNEVAHNTIKNLVNRLKSRFVEEE
jgi:hypothetical protein